MCQKGATINTTIPPISQYDNAPIPGPIENRWRQIVLEVARKRLSILTLFEVPENHSRRGADRPNQEKGQAQFHRGSKTHGKNPIDPQRDVKRSQYSNIISSQSATSIFGASTAASSMPPLAKRSDRFVESRKGAVALRLCQWPVSLPRSSNRTCGFPASAFRWTSCQAHG